VLGQLSYQVPVSHAPMPLADGTWLTCGQDRFQLLLWTLPPVENRVSATATGHRAEVNRPPRHAHRRS
jgi:hypothetical protein